MTNDENEGQALLQTIRIPKNLLFLSDKLPKSNYEKKITKKNSSFTKQNIGGDLPHIAPSRPKRQIGSRKQIKNVGYDPTVPENENMEDKNIIYIKNKSSEPNLNIKFKLNKIEEDMYSNNQRNILEIKSTKRGHIPQDNSIDMNRPNSKSPNKKLGILNNRGKPIDKAEYHKKVKEIYDKNQKLKKLLPPHMNNDGISNIYKIYVPNLKVNGIDKNKNVNYIKKMDKYYDYYNVYKPKKADYSKIIPNHKLSPMKKNIINV